MPGFILCPSDVPLSVLPRSPNGSADAYPGDCASEGGLWISYDPRSLEPRRLKRGQVSGVSAVLRRGPLPAADAPCGQTEVVPSTGGKVQGYGPLSSLEHGFRGQPFTEQYEVPFVDDRGCLHTRGRGH